MHLNPEVASQESKPQLFRHRIQVRSLDRSNLVPEEKYTLPASCSPMGSIGTWAKLGQETLIQHLRQWFLGHLGAYILTRRMWRHCLALWASLKIANEWSLWGILGNLLHFFHLAFKKKLASFSSIPYPTSKQNRSMISCPFCLAGFTASETSKWQVRRSICKSNPIFWYSLTANAQKNVASWRTFEAYEKFNTSYTKSQSWRNIWIAQSQGINGQL